MRDVDGLRDSAEHARRIGGDRRMVVVTPELADTLADLADRAYEAASHLRDRERADFADGYHESATLSAQHAGELEDCLARLDGEDTDGH